MFLGLRSSYLSTSLHLYCASLPAVPVKFIMASAMEKERYSHDPSDEKLEAQRRDDVDAMMQANDPIPDPDAGLSAEERAAIVRYCPRGLDVHRVDSSERIVSY